MGPRVPAMSGRRHRPMIERPRSIGRCYASFSQSCGQKLQRPFPIRVGRSLKVGSRLPSPAAVSAFLPSGSCPQCANTKRAVGPAWPSCYLRKAGQGPPTLTVYPCQLALDKDVR